MRRPNSWKGGRRGFVVLSAVAMASSRAARSEEACQVPIDAGAAEGPLDVRDIDMPSEGGTRRRFTLLVPRARSSPLRLLVLLHGLGETGDARMGSRAWLERYGLGTAYARLLAPPVQRTSRRGDFTEERLRAINQDLDMRPFRGFAMACPYVPNVHAAPNPRAATEAFADWLVSRMIPRAASEANASSEPSHVALDGCSLGGYVGLETFLRHPEAFAAWSGVQSAISEAAAPAYAERLARALAAAPKPLLLETSSLDPFRAANERLSAELARRSIQATLRVLPGPHDQPWLREAGTLEMLLWHDRAFRS